MADDKRIDELTQATELGDDDLFVLQQQGEAKSLSAAVLKEMLGGGSGDDESTTSAAASAAAAKASAEEAATSKTNAANSASLAAESAAAAETAKAAAETAQGKAEDAQSAAETAQSGAESAKSSAQAAYQATQQNVATVQKYATQASNSESSAASAASDANSFKNAAAGSATAAASSASSASSYAQTAQTAQTAAETAQGKAESAQNAAETAQSAAESAKAAAETAQAAAETAQGKANASASSAEAAKSAAETAQSKAESAQTAAESAKADAESAKTAAETAQSGAESAKSAAATSESNAKTSETNAADSATAASSSASAASASASAAQECLNEVETKLANGEFDGADGYTPVKGTDYWTDDDKAEMVSELAEQAAPVSYNAQTLTEAQKAQARENIGALAKNQGSANVGKIPVVGADGNFALVDMPEGVSGDVIGTIDADNNIVITGDLADGTYVFKYENADGTYADIGSLVVGGVVEYAITANLTNCTGASSNATVIEEDGTATLVFTANDGFVLPETVTVSGATYTWDATTGQLVLSAPTADVVITIVATVYTAYTNVLPLAQQYASTAPYVGSDGSVGYGNNMRISTSSASATYMKALTGVDTTALIPVARGDVLRFKNCNLMVTPSNTSYGTVLYGFDSAKAIASGFNALYSNIQNRLPCVIEGGEIVQITIEPLEAWTTSNVDSVAYIMISTDGLDETSIITINEEITD